MRGKSAILGTASVVGLLALAIPAQAGDAVWYPVAAWEMNEHTDQVNLRDATGNHFSGIIGGRVTPTDRRYHNFPKEPRDTVVPQHIDLVQDYDGLDPGFGDFMVQVSFKWDNDRHDMNLVQKGQGSPAGGLFKMKTSVPSEGQPKGGIKCLFRGSTGDSQVESWGARHGGIKPGRLNDGKWHSVECSRDVNGTVMFVDGVFVDQNTNQPGEIDNDWPISIGGNTYCRDTPTQENQCNYWWGKIGRVRWLFA